MVDESHRVRKTSDTSFTPAAERNKKPQVKQLIDAAKVTVFFLGENQYVRPDEVGSAGLIRAAAKEYEVRFSGFSLKEQFRCGGSVGYIELIDRLLGFSDVAPTFISESYKVTLTASPQDLDDMVERASPPEKLRESSLDSVGCAPTPTRTAG